MSPADPPALLDALRAVGAAPATPDALQAGFFHRTLARWLGLPEGRAPGGPQAEFPWHYRFWKAELSLVGQAGPRQEWAAALHMEQDGPAATVRWYVEKDGRGAITGSGWLTTPPPLLLDDGAPLPEPAPPPAADLLRLQQLIAHDEEQEHRQDEDPGS
jgi:hypothetical protein